MSDPHHSEDKKCVTTTSPGNHHKPVQHVHRYVPIQNNLCKKKK